MAKKSGNDSREFSLKPIETQLLNVIVQQVQGNILSNVISFIALERLAIQIDEKTRFNLNEDMTKVTVVQAEPEPVEGEVITTPEKK